MTVIMAGSTHHSTNTLHIMHSWGGGLKRWVDDFCKYDKTSRNFQLQSIGQIGTPGQELHFFSVSSEGALQLLKRWRFRNPITSTSVYRVEYQLILEEIYSEYQITAVIVSSFIGHSLDVLSFGDVQKLVVCHDYYPFCPAINIHFGDVCSSCSGSLLKKCFKDNSFNRFSPTCRRRRMGSYPTELHRFSRQYSRSTRYSDCFSQTSFGAVSTCAKRR